MDNTQEITMEQLLEISINQLRNIVVPVSFTEPIAIPIMRVINNLNVGLEAIKKVDKKKEPEVQLELVENPSPEEMKAAEEVTVYE